MLIKEVVRESGIPLTVELGISELELEQWSELRRRTVPFQPCGDQMGER